MNHEKGDSGFGTMTFRCYVGGVLTAVAPAYGVGETIGSAHGSMRDQRCLKFDLEFPVMPAPTRHGRTNQEAFIHKGSWFVAQHDLEQGWT